MAEIHVEHVTRIFHGQPGGSSPSVREGEEGVQRQAGDMRALDDLTLTVAEGKTCAVIGPSGCGKSTLLRVIAGLDGDYSGEVYYDKRPMRDVPPRDRYIGMVFQSYALYPHFYGHGNLNFFFRVRKAPDAEAEARIRETAEMMGYGFRQLLGRKPGTLSGGEQQRLAIARALVRKPALFLLDEPLSSLDAKLRMQTRVEIRRLLRRFAITAIYVTHDQVEAMALADTIAVMRAGKIEQAGTYAQLRAKPATSFVAGFLGPTPVNLLPATVTERGSVAVGALEIPLPESLRSRCRSGEGLVVGIAPDSLALDYSGAYPGRQAEDGDALLGEIETIEPDFARRSQNVRVRTQAGVMTVTELSNEPLAPTQQVTVRLNGQDVHFFDAATGRNLRA